MSGAEKEFASAPGNASDAGLEQAAKFLEKKAEAYADDHASYDRDTGATEFSGDGLEYYSGLLELAEDIRALTPAATDPRMDDLAALVRRLVRALSQAAPDNKLPATALDYLERKGLKGNILRADPAPVAAQGDASDAPEVGTHWRHTGGGFYVVEGFANMETEFPVKYPQIIIYRGVVNGKVWARPLADWPSSFTKMDSPAAPVAQNVSINEGNIDMVAADLDVRKILLAVVPGDGNGHEVYAKSVKDVEDKLAELSCRLEDFELAKIAPDLTGRLEEKATGQVYGIIDPDYGRIYTMVRKLAWEEGYAIGLHGSFTRDLDMIAVPWAEHCTRKPEKLIARIVQATGLLETQGSPGEKPHGRKVWTLRLPEFGDPRFIDLSIMPPSIDYASRVQVPAQVDLAGGRDDFEAIRLRFFRDLVESERTKFLKVLGVLRQDYDAPLFHAWEFRLLRRALASRPQVTAPGDGS
jgi:hypothetical protein